MGQDQGGNTAGMETERSIKSLPTSSAVVSSLDPTYTLYLAMKPQLKVQQPQSTLQKPNTTLQQRRVGYGTSKQQIEYVDSAVGTAAWKDDADV